MLTRIAVSVDPHDRTAQFFFVTSPHSTVHDNGSARCDLRGRSRLRAVARRVRPHSLPRVPVPCHRLMEQWKEPGATEPRAETAASGKHTQSSGRAGRMMVRSSRPRSCGGFVSKCSNGDGAQPGQSGRATHWAIGEH